MSRFYAFVGLCLLAAGCGGDSLEVAAECNPLGAGTSCMMPWPSSAYLEEDSSTATGFRLAIPIEAMPINVNKYPVDPAPLNRWDGFSPSGPILASFPNGVSATGLGPEVNIGFIRGYLRAETPEAMRPMLEMLYHDTRRINDAMVGYALAGRADPAFRDCVDRMTDANFQDGRQRFDYAPQIVVHPFPAHLVWGREDRIVPVAHAERLADRLPVHILDAVGHMPNVEAAEAFNAIVAGLLAAADASA